jgi:hypothetical protein
VKHSNHSQLSPAEFEKRAHTLHLFLQEKNSERMGISLRQPSTESTMEVAASVYPGLRWSHEPISTLASNELFSIDYSRSCAA